MNQITTTRLALGLALQLCSSAALAQTKPDPDDFIQDAGAEPFIPSASQEADQLLAQARKLQTANKHPDAIAKLLEAFSLQERADIASELGHSELLVGRYALAANHLAFAVARLGASDPMRSRAVKELTEARKRVGTIYLALRPQNAQVGIDGSETRAYAKDEPLHLMPGRHAIVAKLSGYEDAKLEVDAKAGISQDVAIALAQSGATEVEDGDDRSYAWAWWLGIGSTLTVGSLVAGGVLLGQGNGKLADADNMLATLNHNEVDDLACQSNPMACSSIDAERADGDALLNASTGLFITGGVLAAGTVLGTILLATGDDSAQGPAASWLIFPTFDTRNIGITASRRW